MMRRIQQRIGREEKGFTLVELLIVMIVIGLLAAISYAVFIGQRTKAKDAEAKDNVAALAVDVESCRADSEAFTSCDTAAEIRDNSLPIDSGASLANKCDSLPASGPNSAPPPGPGYVAVIAADIKCYVIMGQTDDGHFFWLWHRPNGTATRGCKPAGQGGCYSQTTGPPTVGAW